MFMKALKNLLILFIIGLIPVEIFAWDGMPTPPLHIEGRWLKDPTGKNVVLHGWFQAGGWWFNGKLFNDPTTFTPEDCAEALKYYKAQAELLTHTGPLFGYNHGWYSSFVRFILPSEGWDTTGLVNGALVDRAINNLVVPYIEYCKTRGLYVVLVSSAPSGATYMSARHKSNLMKYWKRMAAYPGIKNADNIMFEICNEPIVIESVLGNGDWGSVSDAHDRAIQRFMQDICDTIRSTGANNIIWVPGLIWQGRLSNFAKYPVTGNNIGYAGHKYPFGENNLQNVINNFNNDWKICSDKYPIIVTEASWHTMGSDQGIRTGTTEVFGKTMRDLYDKAGNISWIVGFNTELIGGIDAGKPITEWSYPEINSGRAGFDWWPSYTWCAPDDGTPKLESASVTENNPRQISIIINHPTLKLDNYNGFTVKIDNQVVEIDSVVLGIATNQLLIHLNDSVLTNSEITFSYNGGNVVSIYEKNLVAFNEVAVENMLKGAAPRITELKTNENGDTLVAKFNMKMKLPSDISSLALDPGYNGNMNIPLLQCSFANNDSTSLVFSLANKVYAEYQLLLSYSGNKIVSSDSGLLKTFSDFPVTNYSKGLPVQIDTGKLAPDGLSGILEFSKPLAFIIEQSAFTIKVNKKSVALRDIYSYNNTILFTLPSTLHYGDTITVSYTPGKVTATDKGILESFIDFPVTNPVKEPTWLSVPGKIEAENYYSQWGISTENTGDTGGWLNVGWIDDGDWLEYGIENNTSESSYTITFRIASPNSTGKLDFYLDNVKIGQVTVPNTGGWQTWQSVVKNITVGQGKHYLKIVAVAGGFNINYYDIKKLQTGIAKVHDDILKIYPNPVSKEMIIGSAGFRYNKVEIIDIMGKTVFCRLTAHEPELHIPVNLPNGTYIVKISNGNQFQLKKIIIDNN
jgi:hypothetical protein